MAQKTKPRKTKASDDFLDVFLPHIRGHGEVFVAKIVAAVNETDTVSTSQLDAALKLFGADDRFVLVEKGHESTVRMADEGGEPEEIVLDGPKIEVVAEMDCRTPPPTGEAAPIPTIGEQLAKQDKYSPEAIEIVETHEVEPTQERTILARLQKTQAAIDAQTNAIEHISEDLKAHKNRLTVLEDERDALIRGEIPPTDMGEKDPSQTPVGKAISGQAPMLSEPPVEGMYRQAGATAAAQGKTELDCPFVRETNARAVSMWFDGFREAKRDDHSEREAQVQALFRDALVENCLPFNGILPPGEEAPKVKTVKWDERPTLVLDMLADGEGPVAGQERWALCPTFDRDEWANLFAETYGPAIAGVDKDEEAKAIRIKGGIDCGRIVKCGRSKRVVGPLARLSIAVVKVDQVAAANAAGEQPKF